MTPQILRDRLAAIPFDALSRGDRSAAPGRNGDDAADLVQPSLRPAAVLVPIVLGPAPGILLTKRTQHLNNHGGQVSFPGGRIDPADPNPEAAALREAHEEIGLDPHDVEVFGRLQDYVTGTGYLVSPVVGLLPPGLDYSPSPAEVEAVFQLPMAVLLDPEAPQQRQAMWKGRMRTFWVWPHPDHYIWGATAAILVGLARLLRDANPTEKAKA